MPTTSPTLPSNPAADALIAAGRSGATAMAADPTAKGPTMVRRWDPTSRYLGSQLVPGSNTTAPLTKYVQEFDERWEGDLGFQSWVMSRMIAAGLVNPKSATVADYRNQWIAIGNDATIDGGTWNGTPEQLLEFGASGQRLSPAELQLAIENGTPIIDPATGLPVGPETPAAVNPITTHRSTSSATINREAAYAAADQMSQQLLGRMASKKEMAKARAVMNRLLAANPTVQVSTTDATDPNNVTTNTHTTDGMSAGDAQAAVQMKMQRSSEGTAYGVGNMFEDAMRLMASREG